MTNPKGARTTSRGRIYEWVTGENFWSVTTIIKGGLPAPPLMAWGMRTVAECAVAQHERLAAMADAAGDDPDAVKAVVDWLKGEPYRAREKAADLGSLVHARIESLILGKPEPPAPPVARPFLEAFDAFVRDWHVEFEAAEFTVYNRTESYAGTADWLARIPDVSPGLVLGDTKTGKGVYAEAALQLSAYRYAEFIGMPDGGEPPMPKVESTVVLHLRPDGYELVPVVADASVFRSFLFVREVFRWMEEGSKGVIGDTLAAPGALEAALAASLEVA